MNSTDYVYIILGLIIALLGFGYYFMQLFKWYNSEKKKIEEDISIVKKYNPDIGKPKVLVMAMLGATGTIYVFLTTMLTVVLGSETYPVATSLLAKYVFVVGLSAFISNLARIPMGINAAVDMAYTPSAKLPEEIRNTKDINARYRKEMEFYDSLGIRNGNKYFRKHIVFLSLPETQSIYALLIFIELMVFTGLSGRVKTETDISSAFANNMFMAGLVLVLLSISAIFFMKKAAEIHMDEFPRKVKIGSIGYIPGIIGLLIMMYTMLPLIS